MGQGSGSDEQAMAPEDSSPPISSPPDQADLPDVVRRQCAVVAEGARHVRIDTDAIATSLSSLPLAAEAVPTFDQAHHYRGDVESTVMAVLCLDAINFGSGWFPRLRKRPGMSGYFTVSTALRDWFDASAPDAATLADLDVAAVTAIFGQVGNHDIDQLMNLFTRALNELGELLLGRWSGSAVALVAGAQNSAVRLVDLLTQMPMFDDVSSWEGQPVSFYKRAQLTAVDLALALPDSTLGQFSDLDRLTIFADNLVPHVLRCDGILVYDAELAGQIDAGRLIRSGSAAEVEMRACAVHAVELMVAELGGAVTAADLDFLWWNRGQLRRYRERPRHRTETWFY